VAEGEQPRAGPGPDKVTVQNLDNPRTLDLFKTKQLAGGWLPEPWSSRLSTRARRCLWTRELWPNGQFPTTVLIVRTQYLQEHPDISA
jgi:NitT/TauT family transport system substrate-binding protein